MKNLNLPSFVGVALLAGMAAGCSGLSGYERVFNTQPAVPGAFTIVQASCPAGKVGVFNSGPAASNVTAWAACAQ
jgi:hypothetical protein